MTTATDLRPVYQLLASLIEARENCRQSGNIEWLDRHTDRALKIVKNHLPSGSGFDSGTSLDWDSSTLDRIVFRTSYHHMGESGMYSGWTDHIVTVRPSLAHQFVITISGRDRDGFKDYAADVFYSALREIVPAI